MKVLLTVKNINRVGIGGIEFYYKNIKPHYSKQVDYFFVGSRSGKFGVIESIVFLFFDYFRFFFVAFKYELIHVNPSLDKHGLWRDSIFLLIAKVFRKKRIVFFHGWHKDVEAKIDKSALIRWYIKSVYGECDGILVLANEFKQKLIAWGFNNKIYLETTIIDDHLLDYFKLDEKKFFLKERPLNALFLARVEKSKGIYELIEAFYALEKKYGRSIRLTIAGTGSQLNEIKKLVASYNLNSVDFLGFVVNKDKAKALFESDIFLLPTQGEGMPISVLEGMIFGLPIITTPVGGLVDFFEKDKMGILMERIDPILIAEYIEYFLLNPAVIQEMGEFNMNYAKRNFLASQVVKRIEKIYDEILF